MLCQQNSNVNWVSLHLWGGPRSLWKMCIVFTMSPWVLYTESCLKFSYTAGSYGALAAFCDEETILNVSTTCPVSTFVYGKTGSLTQVKPLKSLLLQGQWVYVKLSDVFTLSMCIEFISSRVKVSKANRSKLKILVCILLTERTNTCANLDTSEGLFF